MSGYEAAWLRDVTVRLNDDPGQTAESIALDLAIQINKRLLALFLSRKEFAERLGVSQARVSQILSGQTNLTLLSICKAAAAVGLSASILFAAREKQECAVQPESSSSGLLQQMRVSLAAGDPSIYPCPRGASLVIPFHANVPPQAGVA